MIIGIKSDYHLFAYNGIYAYVAGMKGDIAKILAAVTKN
jgi:hypothetical protein